MEALLTRHLPRAWTVLDPFAGSGTTLVQSLESGREGGRCDIAAFNCLLMDVKTRAYNLFALERDIRDALRRLEGFDGRAPSDRPVTSRPGSPRALRKSFSSSARSWTTTSTQTCSAWS